MIKVSAQSCNMSVAGEQRTPPYVLFLPVISVFSDGNNLYLISIIGELYSVVYKYIYNNVRQWPGSRPLFHFQILARPHWDLA